MPELSSLFGGTAGALTWDGAGNAAADFDSGAFATVYNVKGYGAVGDGTTDDTTAVQAAIDAAEAAGGGIVFLPDDHAVTGVTINTQRVHLVGAGRHASALKAHANIVAGTDLVTITAGYCSVRDLTLNGNSLASDCLQVGAGGIRFVGTNLYVMGSLAAGIHIVGTDSGAGQAHGSQWSNVNVIDADTYGVLIEGFAYDSEWSNLWIAQANVGLRTTSGSHFFANLHVWGCASNGVELASDNNRITGFHSETNTGDGIDIAGNENQLTNGEARDNGGNGIDVAGDYNQITGCHAYDAQGTKTQDYGIRIASGTGNRLTGCISRPVDHTTGGILDSGTGTVRDGAMYVRKSADEVVNASQTFQNDDHLALPVEANTDYLVDLTAFYMAAQAADIKFQFSLPAGATIRWAGSGVGTGSVSNFAVADLNATATDESSFLTYGGATATYAQVARMFGLLRIGATAGTAQLQWAQVASNASDTTLLEDSYLRLTPVT